MPISVSSASPFIHLKVRTAYSMCRGAVRVEQIPAMCTSMGMPAVAITDANNMFGVLEFSIKCSSNGIQPICGIDVDIKYGDTISPIVLIAKNEVGYKNLLKLMTCFYIDKKDLDKKFITIHELEKYKNGIIAFSGGAFGLSGKLFLDENFDEKARAEEFISDMHNIFTNNFYIEVSRHGTEKEIATEKFFVENALSRNIPLVATNDVHFLEKEMFTAQDVLMCIETGNYITTKNRIKLTTEHYFKSTDEMFSLFSDLQEAVLNTSLIAKRCSYMPTTSKPILPRFNDESKKSEEEIIEISGKKGLQEKLKEEIFLYKENLGKNHEDIEKQYNDRFDFEISVIKKMGFCGYFMIVSDFVKWAKSNEIPVGPGRGSGAGSVVGWSLKITDLDPIRYNLIFERFLNPERISMPDFDIDFCQIRRGEVVEYVLQKYGRERVAHILALGSLQARAVLRDVGRVIQMPYGFVDKICKLVPHNPSHPIDLKAALEIEPQLKQMMEKDNSVFFLINTGLQLEGLYRHSSMHAAGVVICNKSIDEIVPLYSEKDTKLAITQFNMKYTELAGLVKFDFLGLKTLTIIKDSCKNIKKYRNIDIDILKIDLEDKKTFNLLCNVDVVGVFQLESAGMRDVVEKLQPDKLEDLIALVSLYRPGPMDDIPKYLSRKHGKEPIEYLHPLLSDLLKSTYGVMVYQEQVLKIAQVVGGYTLASADLLRRAMGKKIKKEMDEQKKTFISGAKNNGIQEDIATQIFAQMEKFAGYGFNRSHAAPYALLSYQTAFLKANYRLEFYISLLNLDIDNTDKISSYIHDVKKSDIVILPPDINKSETMFVEEGNGIRYGFSAIKRIGASSMDDVVKERNQHGYFKDINNFLKRTNRFGLNKKLVESLILSGAFDSIHKNRRQLFDSIDRLLQARKISETRQISLFGEESDNNIVFEDSKEWNDIEKLEYERSIIGFYLTSHPIEAYESFIKNFDITRKNNFSDKLPTVTVAVVILSKKEKLSKNRQKYAFLTVSDPSGSFEITIFPELYSQIYNTIKIGKAFIISANTKIESGNVKLIASSFNSIDSALEKQKIYITVKKEADIEKLYQIIESIEDGNNSISFIVQKTSHKKSEIITQYKKNLSIENRKKIAAIRGIEFFDPYHIS